MAHHRITHAHKRSGNDGKWQTPEQTARSSARIDRGNAIYSGQEGMWVTYVRGCETRAIDELSKICEMYSRSMWPDASTNLPPFQRVYPKQSYSDIETGIEDEITAMKIWQSIGRGTSNAKQVRAIPSAMECVFFMETKAPIIPLDLVTTICMDCSVESNTHLDNMCRYVSRLTPTSIMAKATANGMSRLARDVLSQHFDMACEAEDTDLKSTDDLAVAQTYLSTINLDDPLVGSASKVSDSDKAEKMGSTYGIRTSIRHSNLTSNEVIKHLAATISNRHRVDLVAPEKVILVEIYQMLCGIVIVDGATYKALKRFNVNEIRKTQWALRPTAQRHAAQTALPIGVDGSGAPRM